MINFYKKRQPNIEAIQWENSKCNFDNICDFIIKNVTTPVKITRIDGKLIIKLNKEEYKLSLGDYVVKEENNDLRFLPRFLFEKEYELVKSQTSDNNSKVAKTYILNS